MVPVDALWEIQNGYALNAAKLGLMPSPNTSEQYDLTRSTSCVGSFVSGSTMMWKLPMRLINILCRSYLKRFARPYRWPTAECQPPIGKEFALLVLGGSLRSNDVGRCIECPARSIECRSAHKFGRWRIR